MLQAVIWYSWASVIFQSALEDFSSWGILLVWACRLVAALGFTCTLGLHLSGMTATLMRLSCSYTHPSSCHPRWETFGGTSMTAQPCTWFPTTTVHRLRVPWTCCVQSWNSPSSLPDFVSRIPISFLIREGRCWGPASFMAHPGLRASTVTGAWLWCTPLATQRNMCAKVGIAPSSRQWTLLRSENSWHRRSPSLLRNYFLWGQPMWTRSWTLTETQPCDCSRSLGPG